MSWEKHTGAKRARSSPDSDTDPAALFAAVVNGLTAAAWLVAGHGLNVAVLIVTAGSVLANSLTAGILQHETDWFCVDWRSIVVMSLAGLAASLLGILLTPKGSGRSWQVPLHSCCASCSWAWAGRSTPAKSKRSKGSWERGRCGCSGVLRREGPVHA